MYLMLFLTDRATIAWPVSSITVQKLLICHHLTSLNGSVAMTGALKRISWSICSCLRIYCYICLYSIGIFEPANGRKLCRCDVVGNHVPEMNFWFVQQDWIERLPLRIHTCFFGSVRVRHANEEIEYNIVPFDALVGAAFPGIIPRL